VNAEYVAAMEDVLDLYAEPYDPKRPKICFDETPKQLIAETRQPVAARPGQPERFDYEYRRNGTCNLFLHFEPDVGWRHLALTDQRTKLDFAQQMKWLVDERYPDADVIRVILDNLNTHRPGALYEAFEPAQARRLLKRLEFHYTPKHGSWLNMAELEFSVFGRMCWKRRIGDPTTLARETQALETERNIARATVRWQFTVQDARTKLHRLYPSVSS
jgi:transposase